MGPKQIPTLEEALRAAQDDTLSAPKEETGIAARKKSSSLAEKASIARLFLLPGRLYLTIVDEEKPEAARHLLPGNQPG